MSDSAHLKLKRASKRVAELNDLLRQKRPFAYVVETNVVTGERTTRPEKNQAVADEAAVIAGESAHQIRSALDHAYWDIVKPVAMGSVRTEKAIQFPFSETAARLEEAVKNRLAHKVSDRFFRTILGLKPHGEDGGNRLLYLIESLDIPDKHRTLVPVADYTRVSTEMIRRQVPDFPAFISGEMGFSGNGRGDVSWVTRGPLRIEDIGQRIAPTTHMFKKQIDVPVDIILSVGSMNYREPMVPTLNKLIDVAADVIKLIRAAA